MNYYEMQSYAAAAEHNDNERLIMQMNAMILAFSGNKDERQKFTKAVLGIEQSAFDEAGFDALFGLTTPAQVTATPAHQAIQDWAAAEIASDESGYLTGKPYGR